MLDGKSQGMLDAEPFAWDLDSLDDGEHTLVAKATDDGGASTMSDEVKFTIQNSDGDETGDDDDDETGDDDDDDDTDDDDDDDDDDTDDDDD